MPAAKAILLSKAIEGFTLACQGRRLSINTMDDYFRTLARFLSHIGDIPIHNISSTQISAFLSLQTHVKEKTVLNYHIALSALWTWAIKQELCEKHIVRMVERPKPRKVVIEALTETEAKALLASIRHDPSRNRALILLLLDTGARASEICELKKSDIDLANKRIKVLGKFNKERLLPFSPRTASALFSLLATMEHEKPFALNRTGLTQYLRRLGNRAGVINVHAHRFRHTFAITYLRNGGDPYTLQEILGHTSMEMVKEYVKLAQIDLETAHKRASPVEGWKL